MKKTHRISWRDLLRQVRILPLVVFLTSQPLFAEVPTLINYQGRLTDAQGNPVTGNRTMEVRIYDAPTGGNMTYIETINKETTGTVSVTNGTYSFSFGAFGNGIGAALTGQDYLALTVNGSEEQTRTRLLAVPYAIQSIDTQKLLSRSKIISLSGNFAFGNGTVHVPETRSLAITNKGFLPITITGIQLPEGFSGNWSGILDVAETVYANVTFTPTDIQLYSGNLHLASDASGGVTMVAVSGRGLASAPAEMILVAGGIIPGNSQLAGTTVSTFQIGKYEVSWDEWQDVLAWAVNNGYNDLQGVRDGSPRKSHPVDGLNWYDCIKFCNARSEKEGLTIVYEIGGYPYRTGQSEPSVNSNANGYRMPTEAEWEWAARGGKFSNNYTYSGNNDIDLVAWYFNNSIGAPVILSDGRGTWPVGIKQANELGIHDMSGNVWEWVFEADGPFRRFRGGDWNGNARYCEVVNREGSYDPSYRGGTFGLRLARSSGN